MLAIATGWTLEYIDNLPISEFNSLMALNMIDPFTHDVQSRRECLLITEIYNTRRKKQAKVHEMFPYCSDEKPSWLSDKTVELARELIERHEAGCLLRNETPNYSYIRPKIEEEIEIEQESEEPDLYKIEQLSVLLKGITKNG